MNSTRAQAIFQNDFAVIERRTDWMFFWLLISQWLFGIVLALVWSPRTWIAQYWSIHQHVLAAALLGALFAAYPLYLILTQPGTRYTRHMIAIGQLLQSALLVHVTGGRIETHFHVFGSLALLAFYRDWSVLMTATAVVYVNHLALGFWFPLSVYGVPSATIWRSVEHALWVIFEVVFLTMACRTGIRELHAIAQRQDDLQQTNEHLETRVEERTLELSTAKEGLEVTVQERTKELIKAKEGLEDQVAQRTVELQSKLEEVELLNRVMMGREERIMELKAQVKQLGGDPHNSPPSSPQTSR